MQKSEKGNLFLMELRMQTQPGISLSMRLLIQTWGKAYILPTYGFDQVFWKLKILERLNFFLKEQYLTYFVPLII